MLEIVWALKRVRNGFSYRICHCNPTPWLL